MNWGEVKVSSRHAVVRVWVRLYVQKGGKSMEVLTKTVRQTCVFDLEEMWNLFKYAFFFTTTNPRKKYFLRTNLLLLSRKTNKQ